MKRISVFVACVLAVMCVAGCGSKGKEDAEMQVSASADKVYQYDEVNPDDIKVKIDSKEYTLSKLPEGSTYKLISPVYNDKAFTVLVDEVEYSAVLPNYIECVDIDWSYDGEKEFPKGTKAGELDTDKVKGVIEYSDGTTKDVSVEYAKLSNNNGQITVTISDGINTFSWETTEVGVEKEEGVAEEETDTEEGTEGEETPEEPEDLEEPDTPAEPEAPAEAEQ